MYQNLYDLSILLFELQPKESIVHISTLLPPYSTALAILSTPPHLFNKVSMILNSHFLPPTSLNLPQHLTQFTTFFIQNNIFSLAFCDSALSGFPPTILSTSCCHHLRQTFSMTGIPQLSTLALIILSLRDHLFSHGFNYHLNGDQSKKLYVQLSPLM